MTPIPDGRGGPDPSAPVDYLSYAEFGEQFFVHAVTEARVLRGAASLAGRPIEFGPIGVGPGGLVKASASGQVGEPTLVGRPGELIAFELTIPVDLHLLIDFGLEKSRFTAAVAVRLALTARAARPLFIVIDVEPPTRHNVDLELKAEGLRASMVQTIARVDDEVRRAVARYVARELRQPRIEQARVIDVAAILASYTHRT